MNRTRLIALAERNILGLKVEQRCTTLQISGRYFNLCSAPAHSSFHDKQLRKLGDVSKIVYIFKTIASIVRQRHVHVLGAQPRYPTRLLLLYTSPKQGLDPSSCILESFFNPCCSQVGYSLLSLVSRLDGLSHSRGQVFVRISEISQQVLSYGT